MCVRLAAEQVAVSSVGKKVLQKWPGVRGAQGQRLALVGSACHSPWRKVGRGGGGEATSEAAYEGGHPQIHAP